LVTDPKSSDTDKWALSGYTTFAAKETIGNTPAPSVLSQSSWKHLAPLPDNRHHLKTFKLNT
jgi:hypothetical protein